MDSKKWVEVEAPTVEEAAILGLTRLGILREEALIQVVDEGNKGFLGIGARQARVRVTHEPQRTQSEETAAPQPGSCDPSVSAGTPSCATIGGERETGS